MNYSFFIALLLLASQGIAGKIFASSSKKMTSPEKELITKKTVFIKKDPKSSEQNNKEKNNRFTVIRKLEQAECPVCATNFDIGKLRSLDCKHRFCFNCLSEMIIFTYKNNRSNIDQINCPLELCKHKITRVELSAIAVKSKIFNKRKDFFNCA